jgi:hypothetical protein
MSINQSSNLHYLTKLLNVHTQINLQLEALMKQNPKPTPTLIRLSRKASVKYCFEDRHNRVSEGAKFHLGPGCLVELKYSDPEVRWIEIEVK